MIPSKASKQIRCTEPLALKPVHTNRTRHTLELELVLCDGAEDACDTAAESSRIVAHSITSGITYDFVPQDSCPIPAAK